MGYGDKVSPGMGLGQCASKTLGEDDAAATEDAEIPPGAEAITLEDLLARDDLPPAVREWLEQVSARGPEWAVANNPPSWVADEACWEKAKRAAEHATGDPTNYAFVTWFYIDHVGCAQK